MDKVFLEGIELFGYIGVFEHEKKNGQTFYVNIELDVDLKPAGRSDELAQTVSYAEVFSLAEQVMEEARCDLIETYAERLADEIFSYFNLVEGVSIEVRKPDAPIEGTFKSVGVKIIRTRDG